MQVDGVIVNGETPDSVEALAERVRQCHVDGIAIYPVGGGGGLDFGGRPDRPGIALSTMRLNRIIDYPARDLTITAEAGVTVATIQRLFAAENQRLPIDVPYPERTTLGGAISVNAAGPRRLAHGTWRDHVIGMTIVNDRGQLCKSGGRVVKNVAGYDLAKLYTGSLGSLGIITQVTLKLQPAPALSVWMRFAVGLAQLPRVLDRLHASPTQPAAVDWVKGEASELFALFEGNVEAVRWQVETVAQDLSHGDAVADPVNLEAMLSNSPAVDECMFSLLASMPSSRVASFTAALDRMDIRWHAHALSGTVRCGFSEINLVDATAFHSAALRFAHEAGGNVVIRRCPTDWKSSLPVWGRPPASLALMRKIKAEFDPKRIVNPGRSAAG